MIEFDRIGRGHPVVFVHSGLTNRTMWQPQLADFAQCFTCFVIDLPGYGTSPTPTEAFSWPVEIGRFIEEQIGAPAALVGSSFGASQVLLTALVAPKWTGPLVLANSAIMRPAEMTPMLVDVLTGADAAWEAGDHERAVEIEIEGWVDGHGRPSGQAAPVVRDFFRATNRAIWERHSAQPLPDMLPAPEVIPERIEQSVLLIDGPYDFPDVQQSNQTLLSQLPDAIWCSIANTAHFPGYEQPEEFDRIVLEFLERTWG